MSFCHHQIFHSYHFVNGNFHLLWHHLHFGEYQVNYILGNYYVGLRGDGLKWAHSANTDIQWLL